MGETVRNNASIALLGDTTITLFATAPFSFSGTKVRRRSRYHAPYVSHGDFEILQDTDLRLPKCNLIVYTARMYNNDISVYSPLDVDRISEDCPLSKSLLNQWGQW